jgi:hypothetical protein
MVGGVGVYRPIGHKRGGSGRRRAEAAGEELWVPIPEPRHQGRQLIWQRQREQGSHLLHQKAILGCHEEGVLCRLVRGSIHVWIKEGRPVQSFTHGRVKEGRPDEGASDGYSGQGTAGTRGDAYEGARDGANGRCSTQGAGGARSGACQGARASCGEGKGGRRVVACSGGGACGGACGAPAARSQEVTVAA